MCVRDESDEENDKDQDVSNIIYEPPASSWPQELHAPKQGWEEGLKK